MTVSLRHQIAEIEREIGLRKNVYPRWITSGKIRRGEAELHMERIEAALATLKAIQEHEAAVRDCLRKANADG